VSIGAYRTLLDEMQALPDDELTIVNLDIPTAVTTVLGALPQIRAIYLAALQPSESIEKIADNAGRALGHLSGIQVLDSSNISKPSCC
jgi:hypothetical protein